MKKVEIIKSKKGELLLILEEDQRDEQHLFLVCRSDGIQQHLEERQLNISSRMEVDINYKQVSERQRRVFEEFEQQMANVQNARNGENWRRAS